MTDEDKLRFELGAGFNKLTNYEFEIIKTKFNDMLRDYYVQVQQYPSITPNHDSAVHYAAKYTISFAKRILDDDEKFVEACKFIGASENETILNLKNSDDDMIMYAKRYLRGMY